MNKWILQLVTFLLANITPELRLVLSKSVKEWEEKAKQTSSPVDDILVGLVKTILGVS